MLLMDQTRWRRALAMLGLRLPWRRPDGPEGQPVRQVEEIVPDIASEYPELLL